MPQELSLYELHHLVEHLIAADRLDDLHKLLWLDQPTEQGQAANLWFAAATAQEGFGSYASDLERVARVIHKQTEEGPAEHARRLMRHALMSTSVATQSIYYAPALFARIVELDFWPQSEAVERAARIPDIATRINTYIKLHAVVSNEYRGALRRNAVSDLKELREEHEIGKLAPRLLAVCPAARQDICAIADSLEDADSEFLIRAASFLLSDPQDRLEESRHLFNLLPSCYMSDSLRESFSRIVPILEPEELLELWQVVKSIDGPVERFKLMTPIASLLDRETKVEALWLVYSSEPDLDEILEASTRAARNLSGTISPDPEETSTIGHMFAVSEVESLEKARYDLYAQLLVVNSPGWNTSMLLTTADTFVDPLKRFDAFSLIGDLLLVMFDDPSSVPDLNAFTEIQEQITDECLRIAQTFVKPADRVRLLPRVAAYVNDRRASELMLEAHNSIGSVEGPVSRGLAIAHLSLAVPLEQRSDLVRLALEQGRLIEEELEDFRAQLPTDPRESASNSFSLSRQIEDVNKKQQEILELVAKYIDSDLIDTAIDMVGSMSSLEARANSLVQLAPILTSEDLQPLIAEIIETARKSRDWVPEKVLQPFTASERLLNLAAISYLAHAPESPEEPVDRVVDLIAPVLTSQQLAKITREIAEIGDAEDVAKTEEALFSASESSQPSFSTSNPASSLLQEDTRARENDGTISSLVAAQSRNGILVTEDRYFRLLLAERPYMFKKTAILRSDVESGGLDVFSNTNLTRQRI